MKQYSSHTYRIEAEFELGLGKVALVRERFRTPLDTCGNLNAYHLQLSLQSGRSNWLNCYRDHWSSWRFERMGDIFILPAGFSSRTMAWCEEQRSLMCRLDPEQAADWLGEDFVWDEDRLLRSLNVGSPEVRRLLHRIVSELENPGHASRILTEGLVQQACVELSRYMRQPSPSEAKGGLAPWRMRIIEQEVASAPGSVSVELLAQKCALSVRQLSRAFHASRGRTLTSYLSDHRIKVAQMMLGEGASVKTTAHAVGFSSPANFATAFRRRLGCTPAIYRARRMAQESL